jgi:GNAT superfamily N-acetyltransferase
LTLPARTWRREGFVLGTDPALVPVEAVHAWLSAESYWSRNIPLETMRRALEHSVCFTILAEDTRELAGFGRVITDQATFAYVGDVFVRPEWRGRGLSKWLMEAMAEHPDLQGLRRWMLATRDAHALYAKTGWVPLEEPARWMERRPIRGYPESGAP